MWSRLLRKPELLDEAQVVVEHERRALPPARGAVPQDKTLEPAVPAHDHGPAREGRDQRGPFVELARLGELVAQLDLEVQRLGERADRLAAPKRGAADDGGRLEGREQLDELARLPDASVVERPLGVVAVPELAVARRRVPDEQDQEKALRPRERALSSTAG